MTDEELLEQAKISLGMDPEGTDFDGVISQKVTAVKAFMRRAGVDEATIASSDAVGAIVLGVGDLWNQGGGEVKFSPAFHTMLIQLTGAPFTVTMDPNDGDDSVSIDASITLTFSRKLCSHALWLAEYDTQELVGATASLDITKKVLTVVPTALEAATKYAIVLEAEADNGQRIREQILSFTTA